MTGLYLLLNLAALWTVARATASSGWRLMLMLLMLGFVIGSANNLFEAVFFEVLSLDDAIGAAVPALVIFALLAPLALLLSGRLQTGAKQPEPGGFTPSALLVIVVAYEMLYWTAGLLVYPYVEPFYAERRVPPDNAVAGVQVLRSLIFVGAAYPLLRSGLRGAPLVLALAFSIIGGLAPLLPDNPYMPSDIRLYHGIEVTVSNFVFGVLVGLLFNRKPAIEVQARA